MLQNLSYKRFSSLPTIIRVGIALLLPVGILSILMMGLLPSPSPTVKAAPAAPLSPGYVDLSNWVHTDLQKGGDASKWNCPPSQGSVTWDNAGTIDHNSAYWVNQTENAEDPTFYVSPSSVPFSTTVTGQFGAYNPGTYDFFGFVFAYQKPVSKTKDFEFALVDWSWGECSDSGGSGVTLGKVDYDYTYICVSHGGPSGNFCNDSPWDDGTWVDWFWYIPKDVASNALGCTTLVSDTTTANGPGNDCDAKGWKLDTMYTFTYSYTQNSAHVVIYTDTMDNPIFDLSCNAEDDSDCTFEEGRFGFYNYSQNDVMYGKFEATGGRVVVEANDDYYQTNRNGKLEVQKWDGILTNDLSPLTVLTSTKLTDPGHGTVKLNPDGSFVYTPTTDYNGLDSFTYQAEDGDGNTDTATVYIMVNTRPEIDLDEGSPGITSTVTFTEDEPAVDIMPSAVLTDEDGTTLEWATATISNPLDGGLETLTATTNGTITVSYDPSTGELLLQGADTITNYKSVLITVKYNNDSEDPNRTDRIVHVEVNDGVGSSDIATSTITIVSVNDPPTAIAWARHAVVCTNTPGDLDGSDSYDHPDEQYNPLSYGWTHNGGTGVSFPPGSNLSRTNFISTTEGTITFTLTVTDNPPTGLTPLTDTDEIGILVEDQNIQGLTATNDSPTMIGDTTALSATIEEGCSVTYTWDFGDGTIGEWFEFPPIGQFPTHTYGAPGIYIAVVTATNPFGVVTATTEVIILAPIGGHTMPVSNPELLQYWVILAAMLSAAGAILVVALRRGEVSVL